MSVKFVFNFISRIQDHLVHERSWEEKEMTSSMTNDFMEVLVSSNLGLDGLDTFHAILLSAICF